MHLVALASIADLVPVQYRELLLETADDNDLDPRLLAAVGHVESHWRPEAVGAAGERGILQIMPDTATWIAWAMGLDRPYDLHDPATNLAMGAWYLRRLVAAEGSVERALAEYNGGPGALVHKPQSARGYIDRVRAAQAGRRLY